MVRLLDAGGFSGHESPLGEIRRSRYCRCFAFALVAAGFLQISIASFINVLIGSNTRQEARRHSGFVCMLLFGIRGGGMVRNIPKACTRRARYKNTGREVLFARFCSPLAPHVLRYGHCGCHEILNQETFLLPLCFLLCCVALLNFGWHMVPYRSS